MTLLNKFKDRLGIVYDLPVDVDDVLTDEVDVNTEADYDWLAVADTPFDPTLFTFQYEPEIVNPDAPEEGILKLAPLVTTAHTTKYSTLPTALRQYGLKVVEVAGWQARSSNWSKTFDPKAIVAHHTASPAGKDAPDLGIVTNGRSDLAGPLAQFLLARDGTVYIVCGHRANHAGVGGPYHGIPADSGNAYAWGIEAENNGTGEKWSAAQLNAYYRLCAALMDYSKITDVNRVFGHKEWTSRKIDPAGITMAQFRQRVLEAKAAPKAKKASPPKATGPTGLKAGEFYGEGGIKYNGAYTAAINVFLGLGGSTWSAKTTELCAKWQKVAHAQGTKIRTDGRVDDAVYHAMGRAAAKKKK